MDKRTLYALLVAATLLAATTTPLLNPLMSTTHQTQPTPTRATRNPTTPPPQTQWNKTYGGTSNDMASSVQQTVDGGYIVAGTTYSFGVAWDFWLVKTDSNGSQQWNKTYGGANWDAASSVHQTDDGYIVAGTTYSIGAGGADFWLVKTDSAGNQQWNKTYGGTSTDQAWSVQQTSDGGYIAAGSTASFGAGFWDFWLLKTDSAGIQQWNKTYGRTGDDEAYSVQQTSDGGYIAAGRTNSSGAGLLDFWLVKTGDGTPPSAVSDLAAGSPTSNSITLTWTAPGDDGTKGNATGYIVKYSTIGCITADNWSSATTYTQPWTPARNGTAETRVVTNLTSGTKYWFAVEAYDDVSNCGGVSNSPSASTTTEGIPLIIIVGGVAVAAVVVAIAAVVLAKRRK
nr:fibronectin type III domain-containing protein [Candidatus Njordarchaeota archaeon]